MPKPYNGVTEKSKRKIGKLGLGSNDGLKKLKIGTLEN
jgi:hypothetical protein